MKKMKMNWSTQRRANSRLHLKRRKYQQVNQSKSKCRSKSRRSSTSNSNSNSSKGHTNKNAIRINNLTRAERGRVKKDNSTRTGLRKRVISHVERILTAMNL